MMKFEQEPTDNELDELLRDIDVPADLKAQLKQIPFGVGETSQTGVDFKSTAELKSDLGRVDQSVRESSNRKSWLGVILAASLFGLGLFVASKYLPDSEEVGPSVVNKQNKNIKKQNGTLKSSEGLAKTIDRDVELNMSELDLEELELKVLEAQIHASSIAKLQAELVEAQRSSVFAVDQTEIESVIAAMSEQYSIPLGMPEAKVKSRMAQVIQDFPGTRGAAIAETYLDQTENN